MNTNILTTTERVIYDIRERILNGQFKPGEHLPEASLAAELEVSRTPIRDALRILANEELLVYYPNRGYVVRSVQMKDVLDAYDVRGTLEGMACRLIAEHGIDEKTHEKLKQILTKGDDIFDTATWDEGTQTAWRDINTEIHFALAEASNNHHITPIMRNLRFFPRIISSQLAPDSEFFQQIHTREHRLRSHQEHIHIVDAIVKRQGARAESLMREHVYRNRELLINDTDAFTLENKAPKKQKRSTKKNQ